MLFPVIIAPDYSFLVQESHELDREFLESSIRAMEAAAAAFAKDAIMDAAIRRNYMANIQRVSNKVMSLVESKQISLREGARFCHRMRNEIMDTTRSVTSPQTLAKIKQYKPIPPTFEEILDINSNKRYKKPFSILNGAEQTKVYYDTITSSGRDSPKFTADAKKLQVMGRVLIVVTAVVATHSIVEAENKKKEAVKQGTAIAGGIGGGVLGGIGASTFCGPGAPACAVAFVLIGSLVGGVAVSNYADPSIDKAFDEEVEEFSKWMLN